MSKGLYTVDKIKMHLYKISQNINGWSIFTFSPSLYRDDKKDTSIIGMILNEDYLTKDYFIAKIVIATTFYDETEIEIEQELKDLGFTNKKQLIEFREVKFNYSQLKGVILGQKNAKNILEICVSDLLLLLINDTMIEYNLQLLMKNGTIKVL